MLVRAHRSSIVSRSRGRATTSTTRSLEEWKRKDEKQKKKKQKRGNKMFSKLRSRKLSKCLSWSVAILMLPQLLDVVYDMFFCTTSTIRMYFCVLTARLANGRRRTVNGGSVVVVERQAAFQMYTKRRKKEAYCGQMLNSDYILHFSHRWLLRSNRGAGKAQPNRNDEISP